MQETFKVIENWLPADDAESIADRILSTQEWEARICDKSRGPRIVSPQLLSDLGLTPEEYAKKSTDSLQDLAAGGTMAYLFFVRAMKDIAPYALHCTMDRVIDLAYEALGEPRSPLSYLEEPQCTMYTSGCFLGQHSDGVGDRQVAFIANFTRNWQPDFGGCLTVLDKGRWVIIEPKFNSLVLLNVKHGSAHYVSQVATWVKGKRIAITGWVSRPGAR